MARGNSPNHLPSLPRRNQKERGPWTLFWKKSKGNLTFCPNLNANLLTEIKPNARRNTLDTVHLVLFVHGIQTCFLLDHIGPGHGRSVTAMAAYDGQSGSKDRGDPQVCKPQHSKKYEL